jgi:hypothetical protein
MMFCQFYPIEFYNYDSDDDKDVLELHWAQEDRKSPLYCSICETVSSEASVNWYVKPFYRPGKRRVLYSACATCLSDIDDEDPMPIVAFTNDPRNF